MLVILGVGCTVWFSFSPPYTDNHMNYFPRIESLSPFFHQDYTTPLFQEKLQFSEARNVSENVGVLLENQPPFNTLEIPPATATGATMTAVGLGIIVATLLTVGYVPECTEALELGSISA